MVDADMDFHTALSELCGHDLLIEHLAAIQVHSRRVLSHSDLYRPDFGIVAQRHRDLLGVLRVGDAYQVALAIDEHISGPGRAIVEKMLERGRRRGGDTQ
jgi:DNA-binding GntR family transcriptional regulator